MTSVQIKSKIFEEEKSELKTDGSNNNEAYQNDQISNEMDNNENLNQKKTYGLSELIPKSNENDSETRENITFWEYLRRKKTRLLEKSKEAGEWALNILSFDNYNNIKPRLPLIIAILITLICFGNIIEQNSEIF